MIYIPKYFKKEEIFSKETCEREEHRGDQIWRLMDNRILWTADQIRMHFCGIERSRSFDTMTVNNWKWGGKNHFRGLRFMSEIIVKNLSVTSQHVFGRALDFNLGKTDPEEVRQDILANPRSTRYQYITGIELDISWNHIDCRNWNKTESGIFTFTP